MKLDTELAQNKMNTWRLNKLVGLLWTVDLNLETSTKASIPTKFQVISS